MQLRIFTSLVLVFQFCIAFTFGNEFVIYINRSWTNQNLESRDSFRIPSLTCQQTTQGDHCVQFAAAIDNERNCSCSCPPDSSTFVFYDREWACLDNLSVRDLQGDCGNTHYLLSEVDHLPALALSALNVGDMFPINIMSGLDIKHCVVNPTSSWYLGCDGRPLVSSQHLRKIEELFAFQFNSTTSSQHFALEVKRGVQNTELLQGRVINLGILCNETGGLQYHGCILFKLMGKLTCPVVVPDLQTSYMAMPPDISSMIVTSTSSRMILTSSTMVSAKSTASTSSNVTPTTSIMVSADSIEIRLTSIVIRPASTVIRQSRIATRIISNSSRTSLIFRRNATRCTALGSTMVSANSTAIRTTSTTFRRASIATRIISNTLQTSLKFRNNSTQSIILHSMMVSANSTGIRPSPAVIRPASIATPIISNTAQTSLKFRPNVTRSTVLQSMMVSANSTVILPISIVSHPATIVTWVISDSFQTSLTFQHRASLSSVLHSTFVLPLNDHIRPSPNVAGDANGNSSSLGFITGISLSIFLAVVMIGIIGLIFYLRCFTDKWYYEPKEVKNTVMTSMHINSTFQEDDENGYNLLTIRANGIQRYASVYSRPHSLAACDDVSASHVYETIPDFEEHNELSFKEPPHYPTKECVPENVTCLRELTTTERFEKPVSKNLKQVYSVLEEIYQENTESSLQNGAISSGGQAIAEGAKTCTIPCSEPEYHVLEDADVESAKYHCDDHDYDATPTGTPPISGGSVEQSMCKAKDPVCATSEPSNLKDDKEIPACHLSITLGPKSGEEVEESINCDKKPAYKVLEGPCIWISVNACEPVFPTRSQKACQS